VNKNLDLEYLNRYLSSEIELESNSSLLLLYQHYRKLQFTQVNDVTEQFKEVKGAAPGTVHLKTRKSAPYQHAY
jgi:hypothetical protein